MKRILFVFCISAIAAMEHDQSPQNTKLEEQRQTANASSNFPINSKFSITNFLKAKAIVSYHFANEEPEKQNFIRTIKTLRRGTIRVVKPSQKPLTVSVKYPSAASEPKNFIINESGYYLITSKNKSLVLKKIGFFRVKTLAAS